MTTHAATPFYRSHYTGYFTLKIKCLRQQNKEKRGIFPLFSKMVRSTGLEPVWLPTRPSNVRVCLFRHPRINVIYYTNKKEFCQLK